MATKFLPDNKYLSTDNVKFIKPGDIVEWGFDTELNGYKREKVVFHGVVDEKHSAVWSDTHKREERIVKSLDVTYIEPDSFGRRTWAHIVPPSNIFRIWCNHFNPIQVFTVNGKSWNDIMTGNGLNILSYEEQKDNAIMAEVERLQKVSTYVGKVEYKEVYRLNEPVADVQHSRNGCIYATAMTAFANVVSDNDPWLVPQYPIGAGIKQQPFIKQINGIEFITSSSKHYIFLTDSIEDAVEEIKRNRATLCERRHISLGESYVIPK